MLRKELPPDTKEERLSGYQLDDHEIILGKKRGAPLKFSNPDYYALSQKTDACALYCVYGNVEQVSEMTGIPEKVLRSWKDEPWWAEIQKKVFVEQNEQLVAQINGVLDKSLTHLVDRLDNGDYIWDVRNSQLVRKPVDTKVLATLFNNLVHRRQLIKGEPTNITTSLSVEDRLKTLSKEFEKFAKAKEIEHASEEGNIQEGHLVEHQDGNESR